MRKHAAVLFVLLAVLGLMLPSVALGKSTVLLEVAPLYQQDYPAPLFLFRGEVKSVSSSGCGASCISMVLGYLVPEAEQTPEGLMLWACEKKLYHGNGLSCNALKLMLEAYGLEGRWIGNEPKGIRQALKAGKPIIAYMGPGTFTQTGHYIVICGIDRNDRLWVIDPNSSRRSLRWYDMEMIFDETATDWAFLVCELPDKE